MKRRGAGEGSIYKDGNLFVATVETGRDPITGKRRRSKVKSKSKSELLEKVKALRENVDKGLTPDRTLTVAAFLDRWLQTVVARRVGTPKTVEDYKAPLSHIKRALGPIILDQLTPDQVEEFLEAQVKAGYSHSYVKRMRMLLADALRHAQRRGLVWRNVAELSVLPKGRPAAERTPYSAEQVKALIEAAHMVRQTGGGPRSERLAALIDMGLMLGLRPGELTGLLWENVDLDGTPPTVTVSGSMKQIPKETGKGYRLERGDVKRSTAGLRTLAIPPKLALALREHRRRQAEERLAAGGLCADHGLVFCSASGTPIDFSHLRRTFARVAKNAGLDEHAFPYLMRHTVVSHLLDNGATIEEVADITGDDPVTLYRTYRHRTRPVATAALKMPGIVGL